MNEQAAAQLEQILRTHHHKLVSRAQQLTLNASDAQDLLQDTLERAARMFHTYTPGTNSASWLITIMTRLFIDQWRRRKKHGKAIPIDLVDVAAPEPEGEEPPWCVLTRQDVERALDVLPAEWRQMFVRQAFDDVPYADLAQRFGLPLATVGSRLFRARARLRRALQSAFEARTGGAPVSLTPRPRRAAGRRAPFPGASPAAARAA